MSSDSAGRERLTRAGLARSGQESSKWVSQELRGLGNFHSIPRHFLVLEKGRLSPAPPLPQLSESDP